MELLKADFDLSQFFATVRAGDKSVLLLDYDGTLAPFRVERHQARPYPGAEERIRKLMALDSVRLVIMSGRRVDDLLPLLSLPVIPEIWGCHGAERRYPDGHTKRVRLEAQVESTLATAETWLRCMELHGYCERKPTSIALHWRGLDPVSATDLHDRVEKEWRRLARKGGLVLAEFDGGLELRVPGIDKGQAVGTILAETAHGVPMAYLGDDATDEDAFAAMGERGAKILVRSEPRPSRADVRIIPPDELLDFLDNWISCCQSSPSRASH